MNRGGRITLAGSVFCYDYLTFPKSTLRLLSQYIDCSNFFPITSSTVTVDSAILPNSWGSATLQSRLQLCLID